MTSSAGEKQLSLTSTVSIRGANSSIAMPVFGFGTWQLDDHTAENAVGWALDAGYRLIDTAQCYENEGGVGRAIKKSGLPRDQVFIVSKVYHDHHGRENTIKIVTQSLEKLQVDYIDLYLIHKPKGGRLVETYKALLDQQAAGKIRAVGVSTFDIHHLEGLREAGLPTPAVNQIELHPYNRNDKIADYCKKNDIVLMAFSPMVRGMKTDDPVLKEIAERLKKSVPQILIRWSLQRGYVTIPKSKDEIRIKEISQVFDFELSSSDFDKMSSLDPDPKTVGMFPEEYPWETVK